MLWHRKYSVTDILENYFEVLDLIKDRLELQEIGEIKQYLLEEN